MYKLFFKELKIDQALRACPYFYVCCLCYCFCSLSPKDLSLVCLYQTQTWGATEMTPTLNYQLQWKPIILPKIQQTFIG